MRLGQTTLTAFSLAILAASLAACGETAEDANGEEVAVSGEMDVIEARQDNFEEIGDAFKVIRDQLEGNNPDFALISANAETIQTNAGKIPDFFTEVSSMDTGADTEALAVIWEKPEDFAAAHQRLMDASGVLVEAAASQDAAAVGEAVKGLGASCKNCHDTFRLDDD